MEEKKARRNKRIVVISAMLVLLIAILSFGGATFAKYVTSKQATVNQATVAKWGFVVTANADELFHDAYDDENNAVETWASPAANGVKVSADTKGHKVVAPGTKGSMTISISGKAEVAAKLTFTVDTTKTKDVKLSDGTVEYMPVKWTLKKGTSADVATGITGYENVTLEECLTKLDTDFADKVYAPNETISSDVYVLAWEWAFETGSTPEEKTTNNGYDTILGMAAAGKSVDAKWTTKDTAIAFDFTISIEQSEKGTVA